MIAVLNYKSNGFYHIGRPSQSEKSRCQGIIQVEKLRFRAFNKLLRLSKWQRFGVKIRFFYSGSLHIPIKLVKNGLTPPKKSSVSF